jgi:hypothetical protein
MDQDFTLIEKDNIMKEKLKTTLLNVIKEYIRLKIFYIRVNFLIIHSMAKGSKKEKIIYTKVLIQME